MNRHRDLCFGRLLDGVFAVLDNDGNRTFRLRLPDRLDRKIELAIGRQRNKCKARREKACYSHEILHFNDDKKKFIRF
jgi:hypothetical protein